MIPAIQNRKCIFYMVPEIVNTKPNLFHTDCVQYSEYNSHEKNVPF